MEELEKIEYEKLRLLIKVNGLEKQLDNLQKAIWNSAVDKCAETAEINIVEFKGIDGWRRTNVKNHALNDGCYFEPNKESILKNKISTIMAQKEKVKTAEEILSPIRGKGSFIHCVDYEDALKAMEEYANQYKIKIFTLSLQECKDKVAKNNGYDNWDHLAFGSGRLLSDIFEFSDKAAELYASCIEEKEAWISVKDRLPTLNDEYLVAWDLKDGDEPVTTSMDYDLDKKGWIDPRGTEESMGKTEILFWRELPEPPKFNVANS